MSGSVVAAPLSGGGHLTSTIGCILQVDSKFYGLTAGHLLPRARLQGTKSPQSGDSHCINGMEYTLQGQYAASIITQARATPSDDESSMVSGDDMAESAYTAHTSLPDSDLNQHMIDGNGTDDDDFVDDVDYDDLVENDWEAPRAAEDAETQSILFENGQAHKTTIHAPPSCSTMGACCKVPDNDWALVALDATKPQLPNAFLDTNQKPDPVFFSSTPGNLPKEEIPVLIVTSNQRVLRGLLQPVPSFLGGITRKVQAEYWTVILSRGAILHSGDSGAIVIGADSPILVFGHVVASNPLGEVYRVELLEAVKDTLRVAKDPTKVRLLQKFSPDHSEKVLGSDLVMPFEAESTALSTAMKSRTSTIFTEDTDDSDYEFDTAQQERITPKEPWSWPRNSLDADGSASDAITRPSEHDFQSEQTGRDGKVDDQRYVRVADQWRSPEGAGLANHIEENVGITQDPSEPSHQRVEPGHAFTRQRRLSIEEDMYYQHIFLSQPRLPPSYSVWATRPSQSSINGGLSGTQAQTRDQEIAPFPHETLPEYRCEIDLKGVFMHKMEIKNAIQRAEDRQWRMIYVTLHGTALNIYNVKKRWQWGRTKDEPNINPDNPPWIGQGDLVKSYSLQYADCGIAADYKKKRYVIRLRVETDQFLISSVELSTFNAWLDGLNAAISVAAPMEDWDFPRDMSVPRIQRIRWFHGQEPAPTPDLDLSQTDSPQLSTTAGDDSVSGSSETTTTRLPDVGAGLSLSRRSTDSTPNNSVDPVTGKWAPERQWSSAHDMLYAKLCYPNLLFRSPRKSSYIISNGKKWYVDWKTGRMVPTLPPAYG
ncbi:PH domain protein [Fusarium tjaetaba]|uniref:PH domain protein n=1 Tax=Fusarium tjaetaba TaxID=1567544 RepID=A0A8H5QL36_9HYPO|nr:PH domain protein [Fusarium tjaetaba]KAF5617229.1 PH domain protein [Fusarium tjaetaba]